MENDKEKNNNSTGKVVVGSQVRMSTLEQQLEQSLSSFSTTQLMFKVIL